MKHLDRFGSKAVVVIVAALSSMVCLPVFGQAPAVTSAQAEFFETKVRPVLHDRCFACHSVQAQMGSLRLDSLTALLKGGGRGPSLVPGDAEKSLLLQAVHYEGSLKMPPAGKLKGNEIAALTEWVKMGAPWPGSKVSAEALQAAKKGDYLISNVQRNFW